MKVGARNRIVEVVRGRDTAQILRRTESRISESCSTCLTPLLSRAQHCHLV